jgi:hypothetical protein
VVLQIWDPKRGERQFHGLVDIHPIPIALAAVEHLNCLRWKGCRIEAHKWQVRSEQNDRRRYHLAVSGEAERRRQDRRTLNLIVKI